MSKHSVPGGDFAGLMARFAQLQEKARLRTGQSFRIIVIQEAGLDGLSTDVRNWTLFDIENWTPRVKDVAPRLGRGGLSR